MKRARVNNSILGLWIMFSMFLISCGSVTDIEVPLQKLKVKSAGPLFEGVNTATCDFNIQDILPETVKLENIHSVSIASFEIIPIGTDYPEIKGGTTLIASPTTSMQEFGLVSDVSTDAIKLKLTENQSFLVDILKDNSQTLVFDFTISEDYMDNMEFEAQIKWKIQTKE